MPSLDLATRLRLLTMTGRTCSTCGTETMKDYCRQCDEFFERCRCPHAHLGHRTYHMKLAIVGSTSLEGHPEAQAAIDWVLDFYDPSIVISGGAPGIDKMAAASARTRGIPVDEKFPKQQNWANGFKPRNIEIATECEALVRIVASNAKTYGSGWTRDYAKSLGKLTDEIMIQTDRPDLEEDFLHVKRQEALVAVERFFVDVTHDADYGNSPHATLQKILTKWRAEA